MRAAVNTAFDVAFWLMDTAQEVGEHVQPQKLQRLLFLAQAYYSVIHGGRALMPAVFVADDLGPVEPNVHAAMSRGRPELDVDIFLPGDVETLLGSVWRRFGSMASDDLTAITKRTPAYIEAYRRGPGTAIPLDAIRDSFLRSETAPPLAEVIKPRIMRTQSGRPVQVRSWSPGADAPGGDRNPL